MILWRRDPFVETGVIGTVDKVIVKYKYCEWILPQAVAKSHLKFNPRHLPVVIKRETTNEAHYLYLSIKRIIFGYRALRTAFPPSPFING